MKQQIGTMKNKYEPISDLDVLFVVIYNVLFEKIQKEPEKGIVVSKGNPNQRKMTWKGILSIAHEVEDYFMFRQLRTGCDTCNQCSGWKSVSEVTPYRGKCSKRGLDLIHAWGSCRQFSRREK